MRIYFYNLCAILDCNQQRRHKQTFRKDFKHCKYQGSGSATNFKLFIVDITVVFICLLRGVKTDSTAFQIYVLFWFQPR